MNDETEKNRSGARAKKGMTIDEVYHKIKEMIYYNQLAPGQKIIYNDLANRLKISATPVIQALKRLETSRIVNYIPNKGYFVGELTENEARQLYQAREALETYIIPVVIQNLTPERLDDIRETFKKYEKTNRRILILVDAQFHLKIAELANNEVIYQLLKDIFEKTYLKYHPEYMGDNREKEVLKEHHEILESLSKGDAEDTIRAVKQHISLGRDHVVESLLGDRKLPI